MKHLQTGWGIAYHFNKPLEVIFHEVPSKEGKDSKTRPKWDLWVVRDVGETEGYVHDNIIGALIRKSLQDN